MGRPTPRCGSRSTSRASCARSPRACSKAGFSASAISKWWRSKLRSSPLRGEARSLRWGGARFYRDATEIEEHTVSQTDSTREHLIETYRKKAKRYDITSRLYPAPGYPQRAHPLRAVQALGLRAGDSVIDIACGTGLNFPLLQKAVGPGGRIVGVDLPDARLARAQDRRKANGWSKVSLVQAHAAGFDFPPGPTGNLLSHTITERREGQDG